MSSLTAVVDNLELDYSPQTLVTTQYIINARGVQTTAPPEKTSSSVKFGKVVAELPLLNHIRLSVAADLWLRWSTLLYVAGRCSSCGALTHSDQSASAAECF